ncbi:hypothetical protein [Natrinema sp. DC36]|uniref:hypothetical protein n=1 Tax=Natrinema sp. DC36 TaxID=2878680 RepID=UPI001CF02CE2|nr:hypothetical protein [Natrinema sp. DC36]
MVELSIQLLQFLGVLIPVMFASIRFVHNQTGDQRVLKGETLSTTESEDGITSKTILPYSSIQLGATFVLLLLSLLLLLANIGRYVLLGRTSDIVLLLAIGTLFLGVVALGIFILNSLPRSKIGFM